MSIAWLQSDIDWQKVAATFEKAEAAKLLPFARNGCLFMWGAYFCMGAYKRDVVVVIKMVPIFMGCLFCVGAYYPDLFTEYRVQQGQWSIFIAGSLIPTDVKLQVVSS